LEQTDEGQGTATEQSTKPVRVFMYGSLKRGFFNHGRMGPQKFVGPATAKGFTLVSLGPYPGAVRARGRRVFGEVYDLTSRQYEDIERMERGAGYEPVRIRTRHGLVTIFVFTRERKLIGSRWTLKHQNNGRRW
jgi:gamma-glutamylcyclotransferase (GGCT)/AIG2-like uncharacterized protein YtfP